MAELTMMLQADSELLELFENVTSDLKETRAALDRVLAELSEQRSQTITLRQELRWIEQRFEGLEGSW